MGKKRVTYDLNEEDKPPNHVTHDHRHHHHHHRHHNHQKPKKIKSEARLLHTLNSHFKKLVKRRSKKVVSLPSLRANVSYEDNKHHHDQVSYEDNKHHHDHLSSWLKVDKQDDQHDWFIASDFDQYNGGYMGTCEFGQELCLNTMSFLGSEDNENNLFGGDCVFDPDLSASHNKVMVFEEDGLGYGSYIPDPVINLDKGKEGKYLYDMLELSSPDDMINEFLKVNLFNLD